MRESSNISGAWYIAFFLVGILLGLAVLHFYDVGSYLLSLGDSTGEVASPVDSQADKPKQAPRHTPQVPAQKNMTDRPTSHGGRESTESEQADVEPISEQAVVKTEPILCDRKKAQAIRDKAREIAEIVTYSDHLSVNLGQKWAYYSDRVRHSFIEKFVDSDSCLAGQARPIQFYYQGKLFASIAPEKGLIYE